MTSRPDAMNEFKSQLQKGVIQQAYRGLLEYLLSLKSHFKNKYPEYILSGGLYQGYMDMAYFSFTPESFKRRNLKIAIVFNFEAFRFEVWLSGYNKQTQAEYWRLFKESGWDQYPLVPSIIAEDAIVMHTLIENPDFDDLNWLTRQIETGTMQFIAYIDRFLSDHQA